MIHARDDYNRIQDPDGKIPEDEPVFLIRAQDQTAAAVVRYWANLNRTHDGDNSIVLLAEQQVDRIVEWQAKHGRKKADL